MQNAPLLIEGSLLDYFTFMDSNQPIDVCIAAELSGLLFSLLTTNTVVSFFPHNTYMSACLLGCGYVPVPGCAQDSIIF